MLDKYDNDHAPINLEPPLERPLRLECDSSNDDEFGDDDSMADTTQSETSEDGKQHETNEDLLDEEEEEEEDWADDDDTNGVQVKQEDDEEDDDEEDDDEEDHVSATTTTASPGLSVALDNLKKCRAELTWLQNNPEFHGANETGVCKDIMRSTIASLYDEIDAANTS